jgi:hypothetical protein
MRPSGVNQVFKVFIPIPTANNSLTQVYEKVLPTRRPPTGFNLKIHIVVNLKFRNKFIKISFDSFEESLA